MCGNTVGCHTLMQSATGVQWVAERVDATFVKMERKGHTHPHTGTHTHTHKKKQNRNLQAEMSVEARLRNLVL